MRDHLESSIFGDHEGNLGEPFGEHADRPEDYFGEAPQPDTRRGRRKRARAARGHGSRKPRPWKRLVVILAALLVVGGGAFAAITVLRPVVEGFLESNDYPGPGSGEVQITVDAGAGGASIAQVLLEHDVVKSSKAFVEAVNAEPKSSGIQPGVYDMRKQMKAVDALAILIDPANRITTSVTIPEGLWATEIYAKLSGATGIPVASYVAAAKDGAALGLPASAKGNIEGYLFPAAYDFEPRSTAADQLKIMVTQSMKRLTALGVAPADMERTVIIASIVEAEARNAPDMGKVARVILNRLAKDMTLGMDSTVNYIFKKRGVPTQPMLDSPSPYNTRKVAGLPPGPIGNPGEAAIKAAVAPPAGDWIWFTTVNLDTGETRFTADAAEHDRNAAEFTAWCKANPGKC